ncbi:MAG: hypothetical protein R3C45_13015 [Phycisphaerales bacterium]
MGSLGDGTLNIEDGGSVLSTYGVISSDPAATGVVTVTGAGSTWNDTGNLVVGNDGHAR